MVKFGIISDTHVYSKDDPDKVKILIEQIQQAFKYVDEIIHAGDVCESCSETSSGMSGSSVRSREDRAVSAGVEDVRTRADERFAASK